MWKIKMKNGQFLKNFFKLFVLSLVFFGCLGNSEKKIHPSLQKLSKFEPIDFFLDISAESEVKDLLASLNDSSIKAKIRSKKTDSLYTQIFGVKELEVDDFGNIYLTKDQLNSILVYNSMGEFIYKIGRGGSGPGEFLEIRTFEFNSDFSTLYVLDRNEIEIFKMSKKNKFEPDKTLIHNLSMSHDLCTLNDRLFVQGFKYVATDSNSLKKGVFSHVKTTKSVHEIDINTQEINNSFGQLYTSYSGAPPLDAMLSSTFLSCNEDTDTIVTALKHFAYFFGYGSSGELKWTSKIENFKYPAIEELDIKSPTVGIRFGSGGGEIFNFLLPIQEYRNGFSIVQFGTQLTNQSLKEFIKNKDASETETDIKPNTVLINTSNGELMYDNSFKGRYMSASQNFFAIIGDDETDFNSFSLPEVVIYEAR